MLKLLLLIMLIPSYGFSLEDCKPPQCPYIKVTTAVLNVRSAASATSTILGTVKNGEYLDSRGEKSGDWFPVLFNSKQAFVSAGYSTCATEKPVPVPPVNTCPYVQATGLSGDMLNVRSAASSTATIVGRISEGTVLDSTGKSGSYYTVKYNNATAYVLDTYGKCLITKPPVVTTKYVWPVPSSTGTPCTGFKVSNTYQTCGWHTGLDICAPKGRDIVAWKDGTVIHVGHLWYESDLRDRPCAGCGKGAGRGPYSIVIDHGNKLMSTYGHNSKTIVKVGDKVVAGQKVGEIGSLGYSTGPHLHFEVLAEAVWTGNWRSPFQGNACNLYRDPRNYK